MSVQPPQRRAGAHRNGARGAQKALQQLARAKKAAAPNTNRALYQRTKTSEARAAAILTAEAELQRRVEERAHAEQSTPVQLADWARSFEKDPARWVALDYITPPWPNQEELVPRLLECCTTPCPDGGGRGAMLREGMGRGKTLTMYLYLRRAAIERVRSGRPRFGPGCPACILVPKTLLGQWEDQWTRWMGVERLGVLFLPPGHELSVDVDWFYHCVDVVVMTYETLTSAVRDGKTGGLLAVEWSHLVVEEGTTLAHEETNLFDACSRINAAARILISAEPLLNARTKELNGILAFFGCTTRLPLSLDDDDGVDPAMEGARHRRLSLLSHFDAHSSKPIGAEGVFEGRRQPELRWVELRPDEREAYDDVMNCFTTTQDRDERLRAITMMRKIVVSRALLLNEEQRDPLRQPSSKIQAVLDYINNEVAADEKVLVFCDWQKAHVELAHHLTRAGHAHAILDASLSPLQRRMLVSRFSEDGGAKVLLVTFKLSVGVDGLQRANHVLLASGWWNNKSEIQAFGRAERPGQRRKTHFVKFVVRGSIDDYMLDTNHKKHIRDARMFDQLEEFEVKGRKRPREEDEEGEQEPERKKQRQDLTPC